MRALSFFAALLVTLPNSPASPQAASSTSTSNPNLFTDPGWFPALALSSLLSVPNAVIAYVGQETKDGHSVYHLSASQQFPQMRGKTAALSQRLSQIEIFLDASTLLPVTL